MTKYTIKAERNTSGRIETMTTSIKASNIENAKINFFKQYRKDIYTIVDCLEFVKKDNSHSKYWETRKRLNSTI